MFLLFSPTTDVDTINKRVFCKLILVTVESHPMIISILLTTVTATTPSSSSCSLPGGRTFSDSATVTESGGKEIEVIEVIEVIRVIVITFRRDHHFSWLWKAFL